MENLCKTLWGHLSIIIIIIMEDSIICWPLISVKRLVGVQYIMCGIIYVCVECGWMLIKFFQVSLLVWCEISHGQSWFSHPHCLLQTLQMAWHLLNSLLVLYHEPFLKKRYRNLPIVAIQMSQFIFLEKPVKQGAAGSFIIVFSCPAINLYRVQLEEEESCVCCPLNYHGTVGTWLNLKKSIV